MGFEGWGALRCTGRGQESHSRRNGVDTGLVVYRGQGALGAAAPWGL